MDNICIYDIMKSTLRYPGERHNGEFGVEIETESLKAYGYPQLKFWTCDRDNSLRNFGVEYILKAPMNQKEFSHALNEFSVCKKKFNFLPNEVSTSVHAHINFLNDSYLTLANFFTTYALVENLLVVYAGPDRLSNLFCLPMRDAEGVFTHIMDLLTAIHRKEWKRTAKGIDQVKYGGINIAPLTKLGTIEIRLFRGEVDTDIIENWVDILMRIKQFARQNITPNQILEMYRTDGVKFIDRVFGDKAKFLHTKDEANLMKQNLFFAASFATICKDWSKFGVLKIKKIYKDKITAQLDEISINRFSNVYSELDWQQRVIVFEIYNQKNPTMRVVEQEEDI